jgi:hypothetical protein
MAQPERWASHVATFKRDLEPTAPDSAREGVNRLNSSRFTVDQVRVASDKPFDEVTAADHLHEVIDE